MQHSAASLEFHFFQVMQIPFTKNKACNRLFMIWAIPEMIMHIHSFRRELRLLLSKLKKNQWMIL